MHPHMQTLIYTYVRPYILICMRRPSHKSVYIYTWNYHFQATPVPASYKKYRVLFIRCGMTLLLYKNTDLMLDKMQFVTRFSMVFNSVFL